MTMTALGAGVLEKASALAALAAFLQQQQQQQPTVEALSRLHPLPLRWLLPPAFSHGVVLLGLAAAAAAAGAGNIRAQWALPDSEWCSGAQFSAAAV